MQNILWFQLLKYWCFVLFFNIIELKLNQIKELMNIYSMWNVEISGISSVCDAWVENVCVCCKVHEGKAKN